MVTNRRSQSCNRFSIHHLARVVCFRNGGYVFDNFPITREQWGLLLEKGGERGIIPDDVIVLRDESENGEYLLKRFVSCF